MSTRVRAMLEVGGRYYAGYDARRILEKFIVLPIASKGWERLVDCFKNIAADPHNKLWIFREPRRVKHDRSRYKMLACFYGLGKEIHLKPAPRGGDFRRALDELRARGGLRNARNQHGRFAIPRARAVGNNIPAQAPVGFEQAPRWLDPMPLHADVPAPPENPQVFDEPQGRIAEFEDGRVFGVDEFNRVIRRHQP